MNTSSSDAGSAPAVHVDASDSFSRRDLESLASVSPATCVSLYLPAHRSGAAIEQDPIRLRNLLAASERELGVLGWSPRDIDNLLTPAHKLVADDDYWRHQSAGLAVFVAPGVFRAFRAPIAFAELAVVSTQFHIRPLIPLVSDTEIFLVLALSQNAVRLFRGNSNSIAQVDIGDTPTSMAEALAHEDPEKQFQARTAGPSGAVQFYGSGGSGEDDKAALERYFRAVDRGLADIPIDTTAPLVIAAVSYYGPIYRGVTKHPHVVEEVLAGNPEHLSALELHEKAWPLLAGQISARRATLYDRYRQSRATGRTVEGFADVDAAAAEGRIEMLLLPRDGHCWAPHHGAISAVHDERATGDLDLIDDMAARVLRAGGAVVVVDNDVLPGGAPVAAILRYAY
ncbi:MAG: hypothetical protein ABI658_01805 [Acidimicrobiales bacterium]